MNIEILKTELALSKYDALTDAAAALDLTSLAVAIKVPIPTHDVKAYLLISSKWNAIRKSALVEAEDFVDVISSMLSVDFNLPGVEARVTTILDALVTAALIDAAADKAYILSLSNKTISRAEQLGISDVTEYYVRLARGV